MCKTAISVIFPIRPRISTVCNIFLNMLTKCMNFMKNKIVKTLSGSTCRECNLYQEDR